MNIIFLSPHTDDVELGAGGTLIKYLEQGHNVRWLVFSTAEESLPPHLHPDTLRNEFMAVIEELEKRFGKHIESKILRYPVRRLHEYRQEVLELLVRERKEFHPDIVIGPSIHDFHQDHQIVANEMIRAFKTTASILCYELPWNHIQFDTQFFVTLKEHQIELKAKLLQKYKSQLELKRPYFTEGFVRSLAQIRGIQVNVPFAEAFEVIRWIS